MGSSCVQVFGEESVEEGEGSLGLEGFDLFPSHHVHALQLSFLTCLAKNSGLSANKEAPGNGAVAARPRAAFHGFWVPSTAFCWPWLPVWGLSCQAQKEASSSGLPPILSRLPAVFGRS